MPTYQYRCTDQRFTDDPLTHCPSCDGNLRKVYSAVGVVFKGSGFYATDNRTKGSASAAASSGPAPKKDTSATSTSTPAATTSGSASSGAASSGGTTAA